MKLRDVVKDHEELILYFHNEQHQDHITKYQKWFFKDQEEDDVVMEEGSKILIGIYCIPI